ncbi:MAG TPA: serine hydrolase [Pyrinomonadaceae bacterium]|nr:serine hydrolase [Pyrinomonadaceae bacterium]
MMWFRASLRLISTVVLCFALSASLLPLPLIAAQQATPPAAAPPATAPATAAPDYTAALAEIEKALDARRKELGVPGISVAIVKDDKIIYLKGLGEKDIEKKLPVTSDTRFAIGSASKAFTGMLAVMAAEDGKLSLEDSPKKFLPYFTLRDPEAAAKITIRDLLAHRSGLNRSDLAMVTGLLNREELIRVAGQAKPTAKLGEKWQYQNIMYTAAGEAVAKAENSTWDKLIATRIFKPLGMNNSDTSAAEMQKARDFSLGYDYKPSTKETRRLPQRAITAVAPAGAINSSARDMAQWLRLMLGQGTYNSLRLVSQKGFDELIGKQANVGGSIDYGLGWFLRQWNGHKVVEHGGNIDGFNAQVAFMPDQKLGFVLLTNVTASSLGTFAMNTIWKNLVGEPKSTEAKSTAPASDPKLEVGTYRLAAAGVNFEVAMKDEKLTLTVPGQPTYTLENIGGRRYKLAAPAPDGFFCTFRPVKDKESETEMLIEQPQGNVVLEKLAANKPAEAAAGTNGPGASSSLISVDELLTKVIAAYGGEESLRKHKSSVTTVEIDLESQGMQGTGSISARAPNLAGSNIMFTALGKKVGQVITFFDGQNGGEVMSFASPETYSGKRLDDIRLGSDFYDVLNWKTNYKTITVKKIAKVGDEDAYVVEKKGEKGTPVTDYISTKSFLLLKRDSFIVSEAAGVEIPQTQTFSDYRNVDGVMVAFKSTGSNIANGDVVIRVVDVKFDVDIPDTVFHKPANPPKRTDQ